MPVIGHPRDHAPITCFRRFALQILCTLRVFAFILSASVIGSPASYDEFVENTKQLEHESTIFFFLFDKHLSCLFHKSNKPLFLWLTGAINHSLCWESTRKACKLIYKLFSKTKTFSTINILGKERRRLSLKDRESAGICGRNASSRKKKFASASFMRLAR